MIPHPQFSNREKEIYQSYVLQQSDCLDDIHEAGKIFLLLSVEEYNEEILDSLKCLLLQKAQSKEESMQSFSKISHWHFLQIVVLRIVKLSFLLAF